VGTGDGTFTPAGDLLALGNRAEGLVVADFDRDGICDAAVTTDVSDPSSPSVVSILRGLATGGVANGNFASVGSYSLISNESGGISTADLNADGKLDLIVPNATRVFVLTNNGVGGFSRPMPFEAVTNSSFDRTLIADFNNDGMFDILALGASCELLLGRCPNPLLSRPTIVDVRDVPHDQGGAVSIEWLRSPLDLLGSRLITAYRVWRRITSAEALGENRVLLQDSQGASDVPAHAVWVRQEPSSQSFWEALATLPAEFLPGYAYMAATTQDSILGSNPFTAFFVSALTQDPFVFVESNVDSGYSVDNLAPAIPKNVRGTGVQPGVLRLHWRPNTEPDLLHYAIYKGHDPRFEISTSNRIGVTPDTTFIDGDFGVANFYRVTAVDIHGNESPNPPLVTAVEQVASRTMLHTPFEPPDGGPVQIRYALRAGLLDAQLEIFDVVGHRIRVFTLRERTSGEHVEAWDRRTAQGIQVSRGLYLVRLSAGDQTFARKFVVTRR
jgi:hypothetical protein